MNIIGTNGNDTLIGEAGDDTLIGEAGDDKLFGEAGNDKLFGEVGNDQLFGGVGDDQLFGEVGKDTLDGGVGTDTLIGGTGDDFYIYSTTGSIIENFNEGIDQVESSVSYTLGDNLEELALTGSSDISGTGNALDNVISDNYANNSLYGSDGNDTLYAYGGNDYLNGGIGDDYLSDRDFMYGGSSLIGNDTLDGGLGNDTYIVDRSTDTIIEGVNAGTDTVFFEVHIGAGNKLNDGFTLAANLENLTLIGRPSKFLSGIGNAVNNIIIGSSGDNYLSGEAGEDNLDGNDRNDWLSGGTCNDTLDGGTGDDTLLGEADNDFLTGNFGSDTLTGGAGADRFFFNSPLEGLDNITDFTGEEDKIEVSTSGFGIGIGEYNRLMYDITTGGLFIDQTQFASLQPDLDFVPSRDITIV